MSQISQARGEEDTRVRLERLEAALQQKTGELARARQSFSSIVDRSMDGILIVDDQGIVQFANPTSAALFGKPLDELVGTFLGLPVVNERPADVDIIRADGRIGIAEIRAQETEWHGQAARLAWLRDVTEHKQADEVAQIKKRRLEAANLHLEKLVMYDPLTGALNRRGLKQALAQEANRARRDGADLYALLTDIDNFKKINEELGHGMGDQVLIQVATRIRSTLREYDHLARLGGDEILALLPGICSWDAYSVAERARKAVCATPVSDAEASVTPTVSVGVFRVPPGTTSAEELMSLGHVTLAESKAGGKNRVTTSYKVVGGESGENTPDITELLTFQSSFRAVSQPIISLADESTVGHELFCRTSIEGFEMPVEFFSVARQARMSTLVDINCLRACVAASRTLAPHARVHINIFSSTLADTSAGELLALLPVDRQTGGFCLEINEQQFIADIDKIKARIDELREAGILLAMNGVGFGRTPLELMILLEPDMVKISRSLVQGIAENPGQQRALRRLIRIVETWQCELVATAIESQEDFEQARDMGVQYGQGYLWGKPD